MIQLFLPYTAFHIASYLRSYRKGGVSPSVLYVLVGFGTTRSSSGVRYTQALQHELSADVQDYVLDVGRVRDVLVLLRVLISRFTFVTGNLRRTPSLFFARFSAAVHIVDEGSGTTKTGEYCDPNVAERSSFKIVAHRFGILPSYQDIFKKVESHCTVYDWSIFSNFKSIQFEPGIAPEFIKVPDERCVRIFLASSARIRDRYDYAKWASSLMMELRDELSMPAYFAPHPADSPELVAFLLENLGLSILNSDGVLFEDYVVHLCKAGVEVTVIGEPNSSTLLLERLKIPNLSMNLCSFKKS